MLNYIWSFLIICSVIISFFTGRITETSQAAMEGATAGVSMCIELLGILCMWNGIMKIAEKIGLIEKLSKLFKPLFGFLFKNVEYNSKAGEAIISNISANFIGMGNAATPAGIRAMKEMNKLRETNKKVENDMLMFTVLNTSSFQLIPTTLISMRTLAGSSNSPEIILPIWCASLTTILLVIFFAKTVVKNNV